MYLLFLWKIFLKQRILKCETLLKLLANEPLTFKKHNSLKSKIKRS